MVGAVSVVGSQVIDVPSSPIVLSCGDVIIPQRHYSIGSRKRWASLELSSSFTDRSSLKALLVCKNLQKQRKRSSFLVVGNLGGQYEDNFEDVQRQMLDFFTYKAVRTVLKQLNEMNPTQHRWFHDYIASNQRGYGKSFIRDLGKEKHEIAERVMVTRLQLYGKWVKKCDHIEMYNRISDQNLELLRERLLETVVWPPSDDSNTEGFVG